MSLFTLLTVLAYLSTLAIALLLRGRFYTIFVGILLGVHSLVSCALFDSVHVAAPWLGSLFAYLQGATFLHFLLLSRPRLRSWPFRVLVSLPSQFFAAAIFLCFPWAIAVAFGLTPHGLWLPFLVSAVGLFQSLFGREEVVELALDGSEGGGLSRWRSEPVGEARHLKVVQLSDMHLGPFMSVARLRRLCQRAVAQQPDLVLLTGDFLTMESQYSAEPLAEALSPLQGMPGKVFACFGNHDLECPGLIQEALDRNGIRLLKDAQARVQTTLGPVDVLGFDFRWRGRDQALQACCEAHPREEGVLRLGLLHDPGAFVKLPEGAVDLVFSGHTHGGHLGLLSLGHPGTVVSLATSMPDHSGWLRGRDRLYVHRGTGHYGFPLRIGVPSEHSMLHISAPQLQRPTN